MSKTPLSASYKINQTLCTINDLEDRSRSKSLRFLISVFDLNMALLAIILAMVIKKSLVQTSSFARLEISGEGVSLKARRRTLPPFFLACQVKNSV